MTRAVAFAFFCFCASGVASVLPVGPWGGIIIVAGAVYLIATLGLRGLVGLVSAVELGWAGLLVAQVLLMAFSERSFERGVWTSDIAGVLVFVCGLLLARQDSLSKVVGRAALLVLLLSVSTNLYEALVENNVWSYAPGRAAGLYVNPNSSAVAIVASSVLALGYGELRSRLREALVVGLAFVGVAVTFSRGGMLIFAVAMAVFFLARTRFHAFFRVLFGLAAVVAVVTVAASAASQIELTVDARERLESLAGGGSLVDDFSNERGSVAAWSIDRFMQSPVTGVGVHTTANLPIGPHNQFISLALDLGAFGATAYVVLLIAALTNGVDAYRRGEARGVVALPLWTLFFLNSFASHNILDEHPLLLVLPFAMASTGRAPRDASPPRRTPE